MTLNKHYLYKKIKKDLEDKQLIFENSYSSHSRTDLQFQWVTEKVLYNTNFCLFVYTSHLYLFLG